MTSQIDPTVPIFGTPTTESVRNNFQIAHDEITALQAALAAAPFLSLAGGTMTGPLILANDPDSPMMAMTKGYADANYGSGGTGGAGGIPDAPFDGSMYGRNNGAWQHALALAGGALTGPLLLAADPTAPLHPVTLEYFNAHALQNTGNQELTAGCFSAGLAIPAAASAGQLFASVGSAAAVLRLNSYVTAAGSNYLANGTASYLINTPNGMVINTAPGGAAGAVITWGQAVHFDQNGGVSTGAQTIPLTTAKAHISADYFIMTQPNGIGWNIYRNTDNNFHTIAAGFTGYFQQTAAGDISIFSNPSAAADTAITAWANTWQFLHNGDFRVVGTGAIYTGSSGLSLDSGAVFRIYSWSAGCQVQWSGTSTFAWSNSNQQLVYWWANGATFIIWDANNSWQNNNTKGPCAGVGGYINNSSRTVKNNIKVTAIGLAELARIEPVTFKRKPDPQGQMNPRQEIGFIAEDVGVIFPEAVVPIHKYKQGKKLGEAVPDGTVPGLDIMPILAALVNSVKTLNQRLEVLENVQ